MDISSRIKKGLAALALLSLLLPSVGRAQDGGNAIPLDHFYAKRKKRVVRKLLSRLTWGVSTGYGSTLLDPKLNGFALRQGDSLTVGSRAFTLPLKATLHYAFKNYRVGFGYAYESLKVGTTQSGGGAASSAYRASLSKYFAVLGMSFYRWRNVLFTGDVNIGGIMLGGDFGDDFAHSGVYVNAGVRAEYEFSEYLRGFLRPSFEFKQYEPSSPGQDNASRHNMNAFYIGVGLTYRIPPLPRCFHPECRVQIDHVHGNKDYRSRAHSIFEKQNPHYGENYRMSKEEREKYTQDRRLRQKSRRKNKKKKP